MPFKSDRFRGEPTLEACLAGKHRMYAGAKGVGVKAVQQALADLGHLPASDVTGVFSIDTGASVTYFKTVHALSPTDPVVGPGTMKALDAEIFTFDASRTPAPAPIQPSNNGQMQGKFMFSGEGAKVPVVNFGLSFSLFKLWLRCGGEPFRGYTTASNQGLLGAALLETPIVHFVVPDASKFKSLHGAVVDITINSNTFVKSGGVASITVVVKSNTGPSDQFAFHADSVNGFSAVGGDIQFTAELTQLAEAENNPTGTRYLPW